MVFRKMKESVKKDRMRLALKNVKNADRVENVAPPRDQNRGMLVSGNTGVKKKKTVEMTTHNDCGGIGQLRPIPTKTTDRLQSRQFDLKKVFTVDTPAKASGQLDKILVTKPQLVYCGVGIADQPG